MKFPGTRAPALPGCSFSVAGTALLGKAVTAGVPGWLKVSAMAPRLGSAAAAAESKRKRRRSIRCMGTFMLARVRAER